MSSYNSIYNLINLIQLREVPTAVAYCKYSLAFAICSFVAYDSSNLLARINKDSDLGAYSTSYA